MEPLPPFHDDLGLCLDELWRLLEEGAVNRRSPFHTPTLATVSGYGVPRARTVVLRGAERSSGTLRVHCDLRSDKAGEIGEGGPFALHVYDAAGKVQVRVEGHGSLHARDGLADAAWAEAQAMSRVGYGSIPGPGARIGEGGAYALPGPDEASTLGRPHFGVLVLKAMRLDFLYLDRRGNRRAAWEREGESWSGTWLVP